MEQVEKCDHPLLEHLHPNHELKDHGVAHNQRVNRIRANIN
jgi:hypothetical protein